jgi:hypothetical protein
MAIIKISSQNSSSLMVYSKGAQIFQKPSEATRNSNPHVLGVIVQNLVATTPTFPGFVHRWFTLHFLCIILYVCVIFVLLGPLVSCDRTIVC